MKMMALLLLFLATGVAGLYVDLLGSKTTIQSIGRYTVVRRIASIDFSNRIWRYAFDSAPESGSPADERRYLFPNRPPDLESPMEGRTAKAEGTTGPAPPPKAHLPHIADGGEIRMGVIYLDDGGQVVGVAGNDAADARERAEDGLAHLNRLGGVLYGRKTKFKPRRGGDTR